MVVSENADANHAVQLNAHENVNMARSSNTDTNAARYADAENVKWLAAQLHVNVDSVDTSRNTTNTDAELYVDANRVNLPSVQNTVNTDTRRNTDTDVAITVNANFQHVSSQNNLACVKHICHVGTMTVAQTLARNSSTGDAEPITTTSRQLRLVAHDASNVERLHVQSSVHGDTSESSNMNAELNVNVNHVNRLNVQNDATGDSRDTSSMAASENVDVNRVNQLNVQNAVNMARS